MFKHAILVFAVIFCTAKSNLFISPLCVVPAVVAVLSPVITTGSNGNVGRIAAPVIAKTLAQVTAAYTACIRTPISSSSSFLAATIAAAYKDPPAAVRDIVPVPLPYTLHWHSQQL